MIYSSFIKLIKAFPWVGVGMNARLINSTTGQAALAGGFSQPSFQEKARFRVESKLGFLLRNPVFKS
jgi:hypothetical protein